MGRRARGSRRGGTSERMQIPPRSSYTKGTPNWVDLQTTDVDEAKAFYGAHGA